MRQRRTPLFPVLAVIPTLVFSALTGWTYTQSGAGTSLSNLVPMGHEWVTRMAAVEVLGYTSSSAPDVPDPKDPRKDWTQGKAKNLDLSGAQSEVTRIKQNPYNDQRYLSRYKAIYDAIVGERWVDIAGYNIVAGKLPWANDCFDAVAQEASNIQWDHFMRHYKDNGGSGGASAANISRQRFYQYFVAAAMAPPTTMQVYDGGASGSTLVDVDRNYFLFGRALHLFEDSFSSEHTVRIPADNYTRVRQVKSYICTPGSEQHTHSNSAILDYSSGDVIWKKDSGNTGSWSNYKASNMKTPALVATEATKDAWAAFIRTMAVPLAQRQAVAQNEVNKLLDNWLNYDMAEMTAWYNDNAHRDSTYVLNPDESGPGQTVKACMNKLDKKIDDQQTFVDKIEKTRRTCIYNAIPWTGYEDLADSSLRMYYSWHWRSDLSLKTPPDDYKVPDLPADTGVRVQIKSAVNNKFMIAPTRVDNGWVYVKDGWPPLDFILVGPKDNGVFRLTYNPSLFLSYDGVTGAVKLYNPGSLLTPSNYEIAPAGSKGAYSMMNKYYKQYMYYWPSTESPYITGKYSNTSAAETQWFIDGLAGH